MEKIHLDMHFLKFQWVKVNVTLNVSKKNYNMVRTEESMHLKKIVTSQAMQLKAADSSQFFLTDPRKVMARRTCWSV